MLGFSEEESLTPFVLLSNGQLITLPSCCRPYVFIRKFKRRHLKPLCGMLCVLLT
ncbi:hypothetical protein SERLADRAFT_459133 [Serpula lacrymans var. lacrymans S7.9]|uniref:Uncharacterized protein n=1 Tax=Serpula lacrymans var. lacrymans (strain S7.9) TaxID=578457 RepID=F8NLE6_SERL9|nr:uncharacterized protein SERLADRAFT_459133 [Serpula lacrymans var. lacrymans S7.9]EGO28563.1 hypothetical protein SERLADRAFT_459133 [Serpula lacrymans var. lacrymans S7.9]